MAQETLEIRQKKMLVTNKNHFVTVLFRVTQRPKRTNRKKAKNSKEVKVMADVRNDQGELRKQMS